MFCKNCLLKFDLVFHHKYICYSEQNFFGVIATEDYKTNSVLQLTDTGMAQISSGYGPVKYTYSFCGIGWSLRPLFFIKFLFFHQVIALLKQWKMVFISSLKLFSVLRYANFCNFFPSFPHVPSSKGQMKVV